MPDNQGQTVDCAGKMAYQKSEAQVATNEPAPLRHSQAEEELRTMPFEGSLRDKSARDNMDQIKNIEEREADAQAPKSDWRRLGDLAAGIVRTASDKRGGA